MLRVFLSSDADQNFLISETSACLCIVLYYGSRMVPGKKTILSGGRHLIYMATATYYLAAATYYLAAAT